MLDARLASEFTELYRGHYGRVLRYVARRVGPGGEPEDVTAEVFRIAWDRVRDGDRLAPSWLFGTARNLLQNHWRAEVRATRLHREAAGELRAGLGTQPDQDRVLTALATLDERQREVLQLRYWDEFSTTEIAAHLAVSSSAVWVRLHRARRAFQEAFIEAAKSGVNDAQD
jgi:RNA polymerase sigma factor (sigma-70 family)